MRSFARLLSENLVVGVLVLAVVVISDQVREPWHSLATTAVAIALVAYAIRLSLSQYRQHKELRVRQSARAQPPIREGSTGSVLIGRYNRAIKLSQLTELGQFLQSCASEAEAYQLVGNALARFLPECSGALYKVLRGGQRVETISQWGTHPPQETIFDPGNAGPSVVDVLTKEIVAPHPSTAPT